MDTTTPITRFDPAGQHLLIAEAYLQEIHRHGKTLTFIFVSRTDKLTLEIENCDTHSLSLSLLLLDSNPKIQKVTT